MGMRFGRKASATAAGLGLWITDQGMALAQFTPAGARAVERQDWFWQPFSTGDELPWLTGFDLQAVRRAHARSGFVGRRVAMAIPQAHLQSFQFEFDSRLNLRQLKAGVREQLQTVLPWPLADAVWDFQLTAAIAPLPAAQRSR